MRKPYIVILGLIVGFVIVVALASIREWADHPGLAERAVSALERMASAEERRATAAEQKR